MDRSKITHGPLIDALIDEMQHKQSRKTCLDLDAERKKYAISIVYNLLQEEGLTLRYLIHYFKTVNSRGFISQEKKHSRFKIIEEA